jgi:hypothetical protein
MNRLVTAALLAIALTGCMKRQPPLVVELHPDSTDGSQVRHTMIALRPTTKKVVLNLDLLHPDEFKEYRVMLKRGTETVTSSDHLTMFNEMVRMDLDADQVPPGSYSLVLEGMDQKGSVHPVSTFNFQATARGD